MQDFEPVMTRPHKKPIPAVLWSRSNLDRLRLPVPATGSGYRLRLRITKFFNTSLSKNTVLKTKVNNLDFFQVYLFCLQICVYIVEMWLNLQELSLLCHHSTPKPNSNSPEPELFHRLRLQLKSPASAAPAPKHCLPVQQMCSPLPEPLPGSQDFIISL